MKGTLFGRVGRLIYVAGFVLLGLAAIVLFGLGTLFGFAVGVDDHITAREYVLVYGIVALAFVAAIALVFLHVKRLHDIGIPGWWVLPPIGFQALFEVAAVLEAVSLPFVLPFYVQLLPLMVLAAACTLWPGQRRANRWG